MSSFCSRREQPSDSSYGVRSNSDCRTGQPESDAQSNLNPTTQRNGFVEKAAGGICKKIVKVLRSLPPHSWIAAAPLQIVKGGIEIHMHNDEKRLLKSSEAMFDFADALGTPADPLQWVTYIPNIDAPEHLLQWILRTMALCLMIVEGGDNYVLHDDASVKAKRKRWRNGILVLNRMVNSLGPIGLILYDACARINYMLIPSGGSGGNARTREDIADRAAEMLRDELVAARQDNVPVFNLANAIGMILEFATPHAVICERLGLDIFSGVQIKSLFVQLEDLDGEFALVNVSETSRTEGDPVSTYIYEATQRLKNAFLAEILNPNPLGDMEQYRKFTISDKIQKTALSAGECPVVFGPVKSSTDNLHRLLWSVRCSLLVQEITSFLIELGVFERGSWAKPECRAVYQKSGHIISTPANRYQIAIPLTLKSCTVLLGKPCNVCLGTSKQCEVCLDKDTFGMKSDTWTIQSMYLLNSGTRLLFDSPMRYISVLEKTCSAAI